MICIGVDDTRRACVVVHWNGRWCGWLCRMMMMMSTCPSTSWTTMTMTIRRTARTRRLENRSIVRVQMQILQAHLRPQHLTEAVGRGPGNHRGCPQLMGYNHRCWSASGFLRTDCGAGFLLAQSFVLFYGICYTGVPVVLKFENCPEVLVIW